MYIYIYVYIYIICACSLGNQHGQPFFGSCCTKDSVARFGAYITPSFEKYNFSPSFRSGSYPQNRQMWVCRFLGIPPKKKREEKKSGFPFGSPFNPQKKGNLQKRDNHVVFLIVVPPTWTPFGSNKTEDPPTYSTCNS